MAKNTTQSPVPRPAHRVSWNDPATRALVYQVLALTLVGAGVWFLVHNTLHNLSLRNIATGFGFLHRE
ncbi:MAG: amino acid ABC transporter permease, partial [Achromobacter spanius]